MAVDNEIMTVLQKEGKRLIESLDLDSIGYRPQYIGKLDGKEIYFEAPTDRHFEKIGDDLFPYRGH